MGHPNIIYFLLYEGDFYNSPLLSFTWIIYIGVLVGSSVTRLDGRKKKLDEWTK